jgi:ABC-type uncharacterized transport system ATPase subunit
MITLSNQIINFKFNKNKLNFFEPQKNLNINVMQINNLSIAKNKVYYCMKNKIDTKAHRLLLNIINGEFILNSKFQKEDFFSVNYFSNTKRFDKELNILDNISNIITEEGFKNKNEIFSIFNKIINFVDIDEVHKFLPLELFSTGNIAKILYSIPLFLDYDLYILSQPDDSIDKFFYDKLEKKIFELKDKEKTIIIDSDFFNIKLFDYTIDFTNLDDVKVRDYILKDTESYQIKDAKSFNSNKNKYDFSYIQNLKLSKSQQETISKLTVNLNSESNDNFLILNLSFFSHLNLSYTFKIGISVLSLNKTLISQVNPVWSYCDKNGWFNQKIKMDNIFKNYEIYEFFISIKAEHENERNLGLVKKIVQNLKIFQITMSLQNNSMLVEDKFLFTDETSPPHHIQEINR